MATGPAHRAPPRISRWATHAALLVVQMAFAGGAVEGKLAMRPLASGGGGVDPFALAMARMLGAALFFQLLARFRPSPRLPLRVHGRLAMLSVLGIALNQTLYLVGLRITTAFAAALLGATIPVFTAALAIVFKVEKPVARTGVGLALAFSGVLWLTGIGSIDVGATVIAINCLSYAFYIVLSKPVLERVGALTLVTWAFTWGAVLLAPIGGLPLVEGVTQWGARGWRLVAFMVACPTIVAYLANAWALQRSTPTMVTVYIYLQPLLAALLQWVQMREPVSRRALVASGLILAGVAVVTSRRLPAKVR
jgi:drug/metabolite transporter (DMT)-like permease